MCQKSTWLLSHTCVCLLVYVWVSLDINNFLLNFFFCKAYGRNEAWKTFRRDRRKRKPETLTAERLRGARWSYTIFKDSNKNYPAQDRAESDCHLKLHFQRWRQNSAYKSLALRWKLLAYVKKCTDPILSFQPSSSFCTLFLAYAKEEQESFTFLKYSWSKGPFF